MRSSGVAASRCSASICAIDTRRCAKCWQAAGALPFSATLCHSQLCLPGSGLDMCSGLLGHAPAQAPGLAGPDAGVKSECMTRCAPDMKWCRLCAFSACRPGMQAASIRPRLCTNVPGSSEFEQEGMRVCVERRLFCPCRRVLAGDHPAPGVFTGMACYGPSRGRCHDV